MYALPLYTAYSSNRDEGELSQLEPVKCPAWQAVSRLLGGDSSRSIGRALGRLLSQIQSAIPGFLCMQVGYYCNRLAKQTVYKVLV